eukprot:TRINITY_DN11884_c0_g1_i1.p1 TRINITY_DN11884_c0_g1~~TRINITY_DN11884_c0_g1_i1.p1  ORF type:complete len:306 (-),score=15.42 TRINITY_DN11884_c0_g1_i1:54-971(-)
MEPPCFGRRNRNFMLCSVIGPFFSSISRFPGLADQSAAIVRVFAAFICICNLAIWWKGGVTSGSRILANLALFFFSCSCFLIHQSSIFTCVLWFVHASLVIAYVLVYHTMTLLGTSLVPHMCFLAVCLLCGGALRLFHQSGTVPVDSTGILYVTLLCVIGGALLVNAASSLDQVRCAIDALRSTCALIWRRFCLHPSVSRHTARSTEIEACELNVIGKIEETADMPVACDVLSATAPPVCKNQIALREEGYAVQVAKISRMIQSALRTGATGLRAHVASFDPSCVAVACSLTIISTLCLRGRRSR